MVAPRSTSRDRITLIELLIAIAIFGLLIGLSVPAILARIELPALLLPGVGRLPA